MEFEQRAKEFFNGDGFYFVFHGRKNDLLLESVLSVSKGIPLLRERRGLDCCFVEFEFNPERSAKELCLWRVENSIPVLRRSGWKRNCQIDSFLAYLDFKETGEEHHGGKSQERT